MDLKNKAIVITGAARGLGAAMAKRLASKGAKLALVDLDQASVDETAKACIAAGAAAAKGYAINVSDALMIKYKDGELISKMSLAHWQQVIDVNLTGVFLCGREAALKMIEIGSKGCIINISSISRSGNMGQTNYSAAKAGVEAMAVVWAKELSRYGIRAASIAPGFVNTEMVAAMKPDALAKIAAGIPLKRMAEPDELAHAVEFILENDYYSGRCLELDGGLRL
jgi:3-oxoacyl-[acyl-carrier protein] reductase